MTFSVKFNLLLVTLFICFDQNCCVYYCVYAEQGQSECSLECPHCQVAFCEALFFFIADLLNLYLIFSKLN